jgi:hypothetical protein
VPKHEGSLRELQIKSGWIVQDNNLLACSERHLRAVFDMLRTQKRGACFNGGLDKHYLQPWHRELFDSISLNELWFACDQTKDLPWLERATGILEGISIEKKRCYTLIGYDGESLEDAVRRVEAVYALGFLPFCQLYQPDEPRVYPLEWRQVHRKWSRPAAYRSKQIPENSQQTHLF